MLKGRFGKFLIAWIEGLKGRSPRRPPPPPRRTTALKELYMELIGSLSSNCFKTFMFFDIRLHTRTFNLINTYWVKNCVHSLFSKKFTAFFCQLVNKISQICQSFRRSSGLVQINSRQGLKIIVFGGRVDKGFKERFPKFYFIMRSLNNKWSARKSVPTNLHVQTDNAVSRAKFAQQLRKIIDFSRCNTFFC